MSFYIGNAAHEGAEFRNWFIGDLSAWSGGSRGFGLRDTKQVSLKWGVHPAGQLRPGGWAEGDEFVTMSALVSGQFVLSYDDGEARLIQPGDYALWGPGTRHNWRAARDCVVITVRWRPD